MTDIKKKIERLDFECLKFKLVTGEGWSLEKADYVENLYKGFLYVCATTSDIIVVPSKEIDDFWHMHILDTQKYHEECNDIFGKYLHHFPYLGIIDNQDPVFVDNFKKTKEVFMNLFGLDISISWEKYQEQESKNIHGKEYQYKKGW